MPTQLQQGEALMKKCLPQIETLFNDEISSDPRKEVHVVIDTSDATAAKVALALGVVASGIVIMRAKREALRRATFPIYNPNLSSLVMRKKGKSDLFVFDRTGCSHFVLPWRPVQF